MLSNRNHSKLEEGPHGVPQIFFDVEAIAIEARYGDELSAHRAKRVWAETLESHFLLDESADYLVGVSPHEEEELCFVLRCHFSSACARYAFWRITNNQAPEAQYVLETAHIPFTSDSWLEFQASSDLRDLASEADPNPLSLDPKNRSVQLNKKWFEKFEDMLDKIVRSFDPK